MRTETWHPGPSGVLWAVGLRGCWMPRSPHHEEEEKGEVKDKDTEDGDEQNEKDETID